MTQEFYKNYKKKNFFFFFFYWSGGTDSWNVSSLKRFALRLKSACLPSTRSWRIEDRVDFHDWKSGTIKDSSTSNNRIDATYSFSLSRPAVDSVARDFVKLLAKLDGGPMGSVIQCIYQTLAVEIQNARANQVYSRSHMYSFNFLTVDISRTTTPF
jgi:hypothetical protein